MNTLTEASCSDLNMQALWSTPEPTLGRAQASRTHGPTHELLTGAGQNVSTDTKGNITLIPSVLRPNASSLSLAWDFDNRVKSADVGNDGSNDVVYQFDALGRRVFRNDGTNSTVFVQSGQQTIADYPAGTAPSSPTYRYVYASYIDEPVLRFKPTGSESIYYHRNQQYSVVALTNGSGTIVERYAYTAYGAPTFADASGNVLSASAYSNRYTYTGREWDGMSHQYHYRARFYDASLGRFCSRDPIGYQETLSSLYSYVAAQPIVFTDPTGNWIFFDPEYYSPGEPRGPRGLFPPEPMPHAGICSRLATSGSCGGCTAAGCENDLDKLIDAIKQVPWTVFYGPNTCGRWRWHILM